MLHDSDQGTGRVRRGRLLGGVALIAAAAVLGVLTLGTDGDPGSAGPIDAGGSAAEEPLARGDAICAAARDEFLRLQASPPTTAAQAAELTSQLLEIAGSETEELRKLGGDLGPALDAYLKARERGIDELRRGHVAARRGEVRAYERARRRLAAGQRERLLLARRAGFRRCSLPLARIERRPGAIVD